MMIDWIKCSDRYPSEGKSVIVYGKQMSSHWPDIGYAKWDSSTRTWKNCFAYGCEDLIRENEVDHWTELKLPEGLHD